MTFPLKGLIAATALGTTIAAPAVAETTIRLSTYVNEADIRYDGFVHFAKLVEEKTGGSVEVQIFPSATLHGWSEGVDAVQGGPGRIVDALRRLGDHHRHGAGAQQHGAAASTAAASSFIAL